MEIINIDYYKLSASQGDSNSQFSLGYIYYFEFNGKYIDQTIHYFSLSASEYNPDSCFILGSIYSTKMLSETDFKKGVHYYKNGSSFNEYKRKNNLGVIYANGLNNEKTVFVIKI